MEEAQQQQSPAADRPPPAPRPRPTPAPRPTITVEQFEHVVKSIESSQLPADAKAEIIQLVSLLYGFSHPTP